MVPAFRLAFVVCLALAVRAAAAPVASTPPAKDPAAKISREHRSPKNVRRPLRKKTEYIILHTTEGAAKGSLAKVSKNGECHYLVDEKGVIYLIIDRARVAKHAGVSMWNGRTGLDDCSIGIEIVGDHDRDCTPAQYTSLKKLVTELKKVYAIPDDRVLTHSMVAYGKPNLWQKKNHRGRKRCAMLFALPSVRAKLGLSKKPAFDPDVKAGRLRVGDPELADILYKATTHPSIRTTAQSAANPLPSPAKPADKTAAPAANPLPSPAKPASKPTAPATKPAPPPTAKPVSSPLAKLATKLAAPTAKPVSSPPAKPATKAAAPASTASFSSTAADVFYFPKGKPYVVGSALTKETADALAKTATVLQGYRVAGTVRVGKPVFALVGTAWNKPTTYYWTRETGLIAGDKVSDKSIPKDAVVFVKK